MQAHDSEQTLADYSLHLMGSMNIDRRRIRAMCLSGIGQRSMMSVRYLIHGLGYNWSETQMESKLGYKQLLVDRLVFVFQKLMRQVVVAVRSFSEEPRSTSLFLNQSFFDGTTLGHPRGCTRQIGYRILSEPFCRGFGIAACEPQSVSELVLWLV